MRKQIKRYYLLKYAGLFHAYRKYDMRIKICLHNLYPPSESCPNMELILIDHNSCNIWGTPS